MFTNAKPDAESVMALQLASIGRELHVLPGAGGILDQDSYHMFLLQAGLQVLHEKDEQQQKKEINRAKRK